MAIGQDDVVKFVKNLEKQAIPKTKDISKTVTQTLKDSAKYADAVAKEEATIRNRLNGIEQRRLRRLEIEANPNASPAARTKATSQLDATKPTPETAAEYKQRETDRIANSQAGKTYRDQQQAAAQSATQQQYNAAQQQKDAVRQRIESERIRRQQQAENRIDKEADATMQHEAEMEQLKADARARIEANREARQRTADARADRAADKQMQAADKQMQHEAEMTRMKEEAKARIEANREARQRTADARADRAADNRIANEVNARFSQIAQEMGYNSVEAATNAMNNDILDAAASTIEHTRKGRRLINKTLGNDKPSILERAANVLPGSQARADKKKAVNQAYETLGFNIEGNSGKRRSASNNGEGLGQNGTSGVRPGATDADTANDVMNKSFTDGIAKWANDNQIIVAGAIAGGAILLTDD